MKTKVAFLKEASDKDLKKVAYAKPPKINFHKFNIAPTVCNDEGCTKYSSNATHPSIAFIQRKSGLIGSITVFGVVFIQIIQNLNDFDR